jgi:hypothetical protein
MPSGSTQAESQVIDGCPTTMALTFSWTVSSMAPQLCSFAHQDSNMSPLHWAWLDKQPSPSWALFPWEVTSSSSAAHSADHIISSSYLADYYSTLCRNLLQSNHHEHLTEPQRADSGFFSAKEGPTAELPNVGENLLLDYWQWGLYSHPQSFHWQGQGSHYGWVPAGSATKLQVQPQFLWGVHSSTHPLLF